MAEFTELVEILSASDDESSNDAPSNIAPLTSAKSTAAVLNESDSKNDSRDSNHSQSQSQSSNHNNSRNSRKRRRVTLSDSDDDSDDDDEISDDDDAIEYPYRNNRCYCVKCAVADDYCCLCERYDRKPDIFCGNKDIHCPKAYHRNCLRKLSKGKLSSITTCQDLVDCGVKPVNKYKCAHRETFRFRWLSDSKRTRMDDGSDENVYNKCQCKREEYHEGDFVVVLTKSNATEEEHEVGKLIRFDVSDDGSAKAVIEWYWVKNLLEDHLEELQLDVEAEIGDPIDRKEVLYSPEYQDKVEIGALMGRVWIVHSNSEADFKRVNKEWKAEHKKYRKLVRKNIEGEASDDSSAEGDSKRRKKHKHKKKKSKHSIPRLSKDSYLDGDFPLPHIDYFEHSKAHSTYSGMSAYPNRNEWRWFKKVLWCRREFDVNETVIKPLSPEYLDITTSRVRPHASTFGKHKPKLKPTPKRKSPKRVEKPKPKPKPKPAPRREVSQQRPPNRNRGVSPAFSDDSDSDSDGDRPISSLPTQPSQRRHSTHPASSASRRGTEMNSNRTSRSTSKPLRKRKRHLTTIGPSNAAAPPSKRLRKSKNGGSDSNSSLLSMGGRRNSGVVSTEPRNVTASSSTVNSSSNRGELINIVSKPKPKPHRRESRTARVISRNQSPDIQRCPTCKLDKKWFGNSAQKLDSHSAQPHNFHCDHCPLRFSQTAHLNSHTRKAHSKDSDEESYEMNVDSDENERIIDMIDRDPLLAHQSQTRAQYRSNERTEIPPSQPTEFTVIPLSYSGPQITAIDDSAEVVSMSVELIRNANALPSNMEQSPSKAPPLERDHSTTHIPNPNPPNISLNAATASSVPVTTQVECKVDTTMFDVDCIDQTTDVVETVTNHFGGEFDSILTANPQLSVALIHKLLKMKESANNHLKSVNESLKRSQRYVSRLGAANDTLKAENASLKKSNKSDNSGKEATAFIDGIGEAAGIHNVDGKEFERVMFES